MNKCNNDDNKIKFIKDKNWNLTSQQMIIYYNKLDNKNSKYAYLK